MPHIYIAFIIFIFILLIDIRSQNIINVVTEMFRYDYFGLAGTLQNRDIKCQESKSVKQVCSLKIIERESETENEAEEKVLCHISPGPISQTLIPSQGLIT